MVLDKTGQSQHQEINQDIDVLEDKHGKIVRISCPLYIDNVVQSAERRLGHGGVDLARKQAEAVKEMKKVDVLIYEGGVAKVFCHHLNNDNQHCMNKTNAKETKRCHILNVSIKND